MSNNSQTVMYREMYTVHVYEYIELYRTHMQYTVCIRFTVLVLYTVNNECNIYCKLYCNICTVLYSVHGRVSL